MSIKKYFFRHRFISVLVIGVMSVLIMAVGLFYTAHSLNRGQKRSLSSISKPLKLAALAKPEKYFDVKITAMGNLPTTGEQELILKGTITLRQQVPGNIDYRWMLPPEARLVSGHLQDSWSQLSVGQPVDVEITIAGFPPEKFYEAIIFHVENEKSGLKIGNSAVFSAQAEKASENANIFSSPRASLQSQGEELTIHHRGVQF